MTEDGSLKLVTGLVKWFDPSKGYGFILDENGGSDILLHGNVLRNFGRSSVADQSRVQVLVQHTSRGVQAAEVVSVEPPATDGQAPIADLDIDKFVVPLLPSEKQREIGALVRESLAQQRESARLLEQAKARVEQLIEEAVAA